ncbi:response regulator [Candidatus Saganbacteria bacterium]|nr:response regulator [Candidatus Saganbacteria bacterium]
MAKKIMVVDDEPEILGILKFRMSSWGYEALTAASGKEALQAAEAKKPDLILLDVMMPGMSGFDVLRELKAKESTKNIPVIMITVAAAKHEVDEGIKLGAAYYLSKPYDAQELLKRIQSILGPEA